MAEEKVQEVEEQLNEEKTSFELKEEMMEIRKVELEGYQKELGKFLRERKIDLKAIAQTTDEGTQMQIVVVDRLMD